MSATNSGYEDAETEPQPATVLVYSDDAEIRRAVILALGPRPAADLPPVQMREVATEPVVHQLVDRGDIDLAILDGEAWPAGGMGICRQIKSEHSDPPPVLVVIGRRDDAWLATWSLADAVVTHPIDPATLAETAAGLLRDRLGAGAEAADDQHDRLPAR